MKPGENALLTELGSNSLDKISPSVANLRAGCPALIPGWQGWGWTGLLARPVPAGHTLGLATLATLRWFIKTGGSELPL